MSSTPVWLPAIIEYTVNWDEFIRKIHDVFKKDFKSSRPFLESVSVHYDNRIDPDDKYGYEEGFWHITSKDEDVYEPKLKRKIKIRVPDFRRAERVPWCRPLIENSMDSSVLFWDYLEGSGKVHTYIWLKEHNYVVILKSWILKFNSEKVKMIVTAFYVESAGKRQDLQQKYERRIK